MGTSKWLARWMALSALLAMPLWGHAQDVQGRNLAASCAACHGTDGNSAGVMPPLAGQNKGLIVRAMREFRSGSRPATVMHQLAKGYTDAQIETIAGYFAAQGKPSDGGPPYSTY